MRLRQNCFDSNGSNLFILLGSFFMIIICRDYLKDLWHSFSLIYIVWQKKYQELKKCLAFFFQICIMKILSIYGCVSMWGLVFISLRHDWPSHFFLEKYKLFRPLSSLQSWINFENHSKGIYCLEIVPINQ